MLIRGAEVQEREPAVVTNTVPKLNHQMTAFRLVGPKSPQEKDMLLKEAIFEQQEEVA